MSASVMQYGNVYETIATGACQDGSLHDGKIQRPPLQGGQQKFIYTSILPILHGIKYNVMLFQ